MSGAKSPGLCDYDAHPLWRQKPLTPAQLLVHDVRLETWRPDRGAMLEINERATSSLVPDTAAMTPSASYVRAATASGNPIEKQKFVELEENYGWMRYLRLPKHQRHAFDDADSAKCRWLHCSSKFPEYLRGFLWALSDDLETVGESLRMLDHAVQRQTRFSKHGKYFAPFFQPLRPAREHDAEEVYPMLVSVPFLDWTVLGPTPPLRFQVDRREGFRSARSSAHLMRSILQHFYRLEETTDRESSQVFAKHKPWSTNRELDLKVRQWYGHYPSGLNVDELWILAIDAEHVVTLSSNQTWKSRWPPLQLTSRISDVSFRGLRNGFFASGNEVEYTATTHVIACLTGAVGMLHRNFWPDMVLCLTDRYAGYLQHLQYRLHRAPSTKLVMDLMACQEELNIVIQITQQQVDMISELQSAITPIETYPTNPDAASPASHRPTSGGHQDYGDFSVQPAPRHRATYRQLASSTLADPTAQLLDNLQRELVDLQDLRDNTDRLVTRTIQLVNIRLEDHGKAILVFTVVTIVFLPLNFVSSFFGMNVTDIRTTSHSQSLFWAVALCVTAGVVGASVFLAFSGGDIVEKVIVWRDARREKQLSSTTVLRQTLTGGAEHTFRVYGVDRATAG
ncbi:hypothetical protein LTR08_003195 [Meristemomyces frigidus]|nr:hypothetical protein LTR08_003195 [Meristemomyces frigidus]